MLVLSFARFWVFCLILSFCLFNKISDGEKKNMELQKKKHEKKGIEKEHQPMPSF